MDPDRFRDVGLSHTAHITISGNACPVHFFGGVFMTASEVIYEAIDEKLTLDATNRNQDDNIVISESEIDDDISGLEDSEEAASSAASRPKKQKT
jgi:hypothetical protein